MSKRLQLLLPDELLDALKKRAASEDRSVSATIRVAIRHYVGYREDVPPSSSVPVRSMFIPGSDEPEPEPQPVANALTEMMEHWLGGGGPFPVGDEGDTTSTDGTMGASEG